MVDDGVVRGRWWLLWIRRVEWREVRVALHLYQRLGNYRVVKGSLDIYINVDANADDKRATQQLHDLFSCDQYKIHHDLLLGEGGETSISFSFLPPTPWFVLWSVGTFRRPHGSSKQRPLISSIFGILVPTTTSYGTIVATTIRASTLGAMLSIAFHFFFLL